MRILMIVFAAALVGLCGCASVQPVLAPTASADASAGYVAGLFTRMKARGFAFVVKAAGDGREFTMPLGEDSSLPTAIKDQTVAIKLPPGTYTVSQWITYATLTKEIMTRKPVTGSVLSKPFAVKAGDVVHLGSYDVSESVQAGFPVTTTYLRVQPRRATQPEVQKAFAEVYPNLAAQPFRCVLCTDTVGQAPSQ
jgi:hypothetical protein